MARKRMIDPGFWVDEKLGKMSPLARLLFMGLISNADDEGRLPGHPALVKSQIYPYDTDITVQMVEDWLNQLSDVNIITIYIVDNQTYIQVNNFSKYQTINRPTPSKYPVYDDSLKAHGALTEDSLPKEEKRKEVEEKGKEDNTATDVAKCDGSIPAEKSSTEKKDEGAQSKKTGKDGYTDGYTKEFEAFWSKYPRKLEKKAAFKVWKTRLREKTDPEDMIQAVTHYADQCQQLGTEQRYIKHASTFIGPNKPFEEYIKGPPEPAGNARGEPQSWDALRKLYAEYEAEDKGETG